MTLGQAEKIDSWMASLEDLSILTFIQEMADSTTLSNLWTYWI